MILHYLNLKGNNQNKEASILYSKIIKNVKDLTMNKNLLFNKEFNTSFELLTLHLFIIFFIFNSKSNIIKQELMNIFIEDLDISIRNTGIGDVSIGKYVKKYVKKYYFRKKKLEKIFRSKDFSLFKSYIISINIHDKSQNLKFFAEYLYQFIDMNISNNKKYIITNYKFNNLN